MVQSLQANNASRIFFALPELLDSQRDSFNTFLKDGIAKEFAKLSPIRVENKNIVAELILDGNNYQLISPTDNPRECILKMKTYDCKLYIKGQIVYKTFGGTVLHKTKAEWVLVGHLPLMTKRGHFIINGSPRVIVQQVVRCPGIYFQEMPDKDSNKKIRFYADIIPRRGVWLRVQITKKGEIQIKFKKGKKIQAEILQKCLQVIERQEKLKSLIFAYENLSHAFSQPWQVRALSNKSIQSFCLPVLCGNKQNQGCYTGDKTQEYVQLNKSNWVMAGVLNVLFSKNWINAYVKKQICLNELYILRKRKQAELSIEDLNFCYTYDKLYRPAEDKEREQLAIKNEKYSPDSSFKAQKCYTNLFSTFKVGSRYDLSDLGREKINTKFGISLSETQLTALDLQVTRYWLHKYSKGEKRVDDIDHSKNRRIRTSASLLQSQFENGIERLKKFTWNKLKEFINVQLAETESLSLSPAKPNLNNDTFFLPLALKRTNLKTLKGKQVTTLFDNIRVMPFAVDALAQQKQKKQMEGNNSNTKFQVENFSTFSLPLFLDSLVATNYPKTPHRGAFRRNPAFSESIAENRKVLLFCGAEQSDFGQQRITNSTSELFRKIKLSLGEKENISLKNVLSTKPITGAFREFFGCNPLSQYMDQTNPLAEITHKRRISSLGVGGVSRDSAGMAIRGIHATHYGRICPIETPEGKNAGLVNSLSFFAKIDNNGFIKTPYYKLVKGQVQNELGFAFFSAEQETMHNFCIAPSDLQKSCNNILQNNLVAVRVADNLLDLFKKIHPYAVDCIGISPIQMISVATSLIPFLEHNDANRALMGSNMQRQAVPLMIPERPLVGTGLESLVLAESGHVTQSKVTGFISYVSCNEIIVESLKSLNKVGAKKLIQVLEKPNFDPSKPSFWNAAKLSPDLQKPINLQTFNNFTRFSSGKNNVVNKIIQSLLFKQLALINFQSKPKFKGKLNLYKTKLITSKNVLKNASTNPTTIKRPLSSVVLRNKRIGQTKKSFSFVFSLKTPKSTLLLSSNAQQKKNLKYSTNRENNLVKQKFNRTEWNKKGFSRIASLDTIVLPSKTIGPKGSIVLQSRTIGYKTKNKAMLDKAHQNGKGSEQVIWIRRSLTLAKQKFNYRNIVSAESIRNTNYMNPAAYSTQNNVQINGKQIGIKGQIEQIRNLNRSNGSVGLAFAPDAFAEQKQQKHNNSILRSISSEMENLLLYCINQSASFSFCQTTPKSSDLNTEESNPIFTKPNFSLLAHSAGLQKRAFNKLNLSFCKPALGYPLLGTSLANKQKPKTTSDFYQLPRSEFSSFSHVIQNFNRSNQDICLVERALVQEGDWVQQGDILTDCSASDKGELAVGKNVLIAYLPWEGYNFEDAIVISDRLVKEHIYTSLHIERYDFDAQDFKEGNEWFTNDLPGIASKNIKHLNEFGLPKIGSFVKEGDILVGKIKYSNKKATTPYERLLCDILGEKNFAARDASLYLPRGVEARVIHHQLLGFFDKSSREQMSTTNTNTAILANKSKLPKAVNIFLGEKRVIQVGDKMSGRHGNKGVVSTILPRQDMPYLADGTPIDIILNPLGVPSRMNVGQVFECLLGLAASYLAQHFKITPFDEVYGVEASQSLIYLKLYQARLQSGQNWLFQVDFPGKTRLIDGRSGEAFDQWVTVGKAYMLKLIHMVNEKVHARSTGPYALITQQPLRGRSQKGGQRLGEMEVWALQGFGAAYTLQELLTKKSDDIIGRKDIAASILPRPVSILDTIQTSNRVLGFSEAESKQKRLLLGQPEIFKVLVCELQALCLDIGLYTLTKQSFQRSFITTL